jgi:hypothetical protein
MVAAVAIADRTRLTRRTAAACIRAVPRAVWMGFADPAVVIAAGANFIAHRPSSRADLFERIIVGALVKALQQVGHLDRLRLFLFPRFGFFFLLCPRCPRPQDERAADEGEASDYQRDTESAHVAHDAVDLVQCEGPRVRHTRAGMRGAPATSRHCERS